VVRCAALPAWARRARLALALGEATITLLAARRVAPLQLDDAGANFVQRGYNIRAVNAELAVAHGDDFQPWFTTGGSAFQPDGLDL
jgi:hypothetical protein